MAKIAIGMMTLGVACLCATSRAQITVTVLAGSGRAYGADAGVQVGQVQGRPTLWTGSAASIVELHSFGAALGAGGGQQVGYISAGSVVNAALWTGSAASLVNLHPSVSANSQAHGAGSGQQVGFADIAGIRRASLWTGSAASRVDLHPAGASTSIAHDCDGGVQVGETLHTFIYRASLWNGSAGSWVDLNPHPGVSSYAFGVSNGQQVGLTTTNSPPAITHAALWTGSAASFVDLNPPGATRSEALGVSNGIQVGFAFVSGQQRAVMWSGTPESWVDLHAFLPQGYASSQAGSVHAQGSFAFIVGSALHTSSNTARAVLWSLPCEPGVATHPAPFVSCPSGSAVFSVLASGFDPLTYQWQVEDANAPSGWTNLNNGAYIRDGAPVATISDATAPAAQWSGLAHEFFAATPTLSTRCVVSNACGSVASDPATLSVCFADFDDGSGTGICDGGVDIGDLLHYLDRFDAGDPSADIDDGSGTGTRDSAVDIGDLLYFLTRFEEGC